MLKLRWEIVLIICSLLFAAGMVGTFLPVLGYEVPVVWGVAAVTGAAVGLAGLTAFGVWQIILSRRELKAIDEAQKARGGKTLAEDTQA